jgi:hypothetical protein
MISAQELLNHLKYCIDSGTIKPNAVVVIADGRGEPEPIGSYDADASRNAFIIGW